MIKKLIIKAKSLIKKLGSSGFMHLFGSSVVNKVLAFVSSFILVRLIPKSDYGIYANADNILGLFCIFEGFGMTSTWLQYGCTRKEKEKENTWSYCFYFSVIFQVFLCIAIILTGKFVRFGIEGTGPILIAMSLLPLFRLISEMQRIYLRTEMMNKQYAYVNNFSTVVTVVFSILLSLFFLVNGLVAANYISSIATIIFVILAYKIRLPRFKNNLEKKDKLELIKFSFVCMVNNSTSSLMSLLDTFILGIVIAQSTVTASYKVASKVPTALFFIPVCVMTYIYPYFAKNAHNKKWCISNFKKVILLFGLFNAVVAIGLIVLAPFIVNLLFGAQYNDSITAFRILCANYAVQSTFKMVPGQLLVSQKKLGFNTFTGVLSGVVNTGLNLLLIPKCSSNGAAMATLLVSMLVGFMNMIYITKVFKSIPDKGDKIWFHLMYLPILELRINMY